MKIVPSSIIIYPVFIIGCLEGPSGPPGRDGLVGIVEDSIIIDCMAGFSFINNRNIGDPYTLSNRAAPMMINLDTSMLRDDSVNYDGISYSAAFTNTKYIPTGWEGYVEQTQSMVPVNYNDPSDSTNWLFRTGSDSSNYIYSKFSSSSMYTTKLIQFDYFQGKGFMLNLSAPNIFRNPKIGKIKIYYWK